MKRIILFTVFISESLIYKFFNQLLSNSYENKGRAVALP